MTDLDRDLFVVGVNAFDEASDQGLPGIRAQIHSVINRHNAKDASGKARWYARATLAGTVTAPYAYSAQNTLDPNRERGMETPMDNAIMQMCLSEAKQAIAGYTADPTAGATHYYAEGTPEPSWVKGIDPKSGTSVAPPASFCCKIGKHLFYKDVT